LKFSKQREVIRNLDLHATALERNQVAASTGMMAAAPTLVKGGVKTSAR